MSVFDTKSSNWGSITIVPPKPDANGDDEFSYSHLYCYQDSTNTTNTSLSSSFTMGSSSQGNNNTKTVTPNAAGGAARGGLSASLNLGGAQTLDFSTFALSDNGGAEKKQNNDNPSNDATTATNNSCDNPSSATTTNNASTITRSPLNGAFTFSPNAEYDLLLTIQRELDKAYRHSGSVAALTDVDSAKVIMKSIDEYCTKKQWMYHVGCEKGEEISRFLEGGVTQFMERKNNNNNQKRKFICVELGTYCGYSALVLASTLRRLVSHYKEMDDTAMEFDFHIYSTEISEKLVNVAMSIFRLSKMDKYITPILMKEGEGISVALKRHLDKEQQDQQQLEEEPMIDFLLLDHAKNLYLTDLQDLEQSSLLRQHSRVTADNVIYNRLESYRNHMARWKEVGVVDTRLEEMNLEYSNNLKDGMEMTVYLKNPPK